MIPRKDQNQIYDELYRLQNCELALAMFYQELAGHFYEERFFWEEAVSDEVNHARWIGQVIALVSSNIDKFSPGIFRAELLKTFLDGIYHDVQKIKDQLLTRKEILILSLNYERSLLELKPFEVVKSSHPAYIDMTKKYAPVITDHTKRIENYVRSKLQAL